MARFRDIKSPVALAAVGAFLVPEPLGTCLVLAAVMWWFGRKLGVPLHWLSRLTWPRALGARLTRLSVAVGSLLKSQRADMSATPMADIDAHAILNQIRARDLV